MSADTPVLAADLLTVPGTCWLIATASGTRYLIEATPHAARVARLPGQAPGREYEAADLRRDRAWVRLIAVGHTAGGTIRVPGEVTAGHPMAMLLDVVRDGQTVTIRQTTPVRHITRLSLTAPSPREPGQSGERSAHQSPAQDHPA